MNVSAWTLGWRNLWRDLRSGELRLLIAAVMWALTSDAPMISPDGA